MQEGGWVCSELTGQIVLSHSYCIISCLLTHCLFGRFFFASFPLYSGGDFVRSIRMGLYQARTVLP